MVEDRLAAIETRLRAAEDQLEIIRLLATYGPAVDCGESDAAAGLWLDDGAYDVGGTGVTKGRDAIAGLYEHSLHQGLIRQGAGHVTTTPQITLDGDTASAVAHSFVLLKTEEHWIVWRASANTWKLARTPQGWRIVERRNRVLDGGEASHDLLRKAVE